MRERISQQGSMTNWVEVSDDDWRDELKYIVDALRIIGWRLDQLSGQLSGIYWQNKIRIYEEGTTKEVRYEDE